MNPSRLALGLLVVFLSSCTTRIVDFTIISTKNLDLSKGATFQRGQSRVEGLDKVYVIVIFPTGTPNVKEAVDRAIESVPGAIALLDGVVTQEMWQIPLIYGETGFLVEGTPLIDPALVADLPTSRYRLTHLSPSGEVTESRELARDDFEEIRERLFGR